MLKPCLSVNLSEWAKRLVSIRLIAVLMRLINSTQTEQNLKTWQTSITY